MKIRKLAATAFLAAAATTVTFSTAAADPAPATASQLPASFHGTDHGVAFDISRAGTTLVAEITGGTFHVTPNNVTVTAADGTEVTNVPLTMPVQDHAIELTPTVQNSGTKLVAQAKDIGHWQWTSPRSRSIGAGAAVGVLVGVLTGAFIGLVVGIATEGLLLPITLPAGLIIGAISGGIIGGIAGGSVPNSDVPDQLEYQKDCEYYGDYHYCY